MSDSFPLSLEFCAVSMAADATLFPTGVVVNNLQKHMAKYFLHVTQRRCESSLASQFDYDASQCMPSSVIYLLALGHFFIISIPLLFRNNSSKQTTAVYKIKTASFRYMNITNFLVYMVYIL